MMDNTQHQQQYHHHHQQHHQVRHYCQRQCEQLFQAVKDSNLSQVEELLRQDVSVNSLDEDGYTPLYWACCRGNIDICRRLLRRGCDVTVKGKAGATALMACADNGHYTCLQLLLQTRSIQLDEVSDRGDTALHMGAYRGFSKVVHLLCAAGANLSVHNINDHTPLEVAFIEDKKECIKILREYVKNQTKPLDGLDSSSSNKQWTSPSPKLPPKGRLKRCSPNSLKIESLSHTNSPVSRNSQDDDHLLSSDSALGFSVHSPPISQPFTYCNAQYNDSVNTLYPSDSFHPQDHSTQVYQSYPISHHSSNTFTEHSHSPVEMDERPFLNNPAVSPFPNQGSQLDTGEHCDSGRLSNGSNKFDDGANRLSGSQPKNVGDLESIGYYSSGASGKKCDIQTSSFFNHNPTKELYFPHGDPVYPPSLNPAISVEDISGPPAICYSSALDNDHTITIYSNAKYNDAPSPVVVSSTTKPKYFFNNLSSQCKHNESNVNDVNQYNILSDESGTIRKYTPNINPVEKSFKNQNSNSKEVVTQNQNKEDVEVLPGLKMSSFLDNLQLKVVMLEESLEKERASNDELQNQNKNLREENLELKAIIRKLTHKLS